MGFYTPGFEGAQGYRSNGPKSTREPPKFGAGPRLVCGIGYDGRQAFGKVCNHLLILALDHDPNHRFRA